MLLAGYNSDSDDAEDVPEASPPAPTAVPAKPAAAAEPPEAGGDSGPAPKKRKVDYARLTASVARPLDLSNLGDKPEVQALAVKPIAKKEGLLASLPTARPVLGRNKNQGITLEPPKPVPVESRVERAPTTMVVQSAPDVEDDEPTPGGTQVLAQEDDGENAITEAQLVGMSKRERQEVLEGVKNAPLAKEGQFRDKDWRINAVIAKGALGNLQDKSAPKDILTDTWDAAAGAPVVTSAPNMIQARKHQINWLAYDMQQKSAELLDRSMQGQLTKSQTYAKYGW